MKLIGRGITLTGYGELSGVNLSGTILGWEGPNRIVVLVLHEDEPRELLFRIADGCIPGSNLGGGMRISPRDLETIKGSEAMSESAVAERKTRKKAEPAPEETKPALGRRPRKSSSQVTEAGQKAAGEKATTEVPVPADPRGLSPMLRAEEARKPLKDDELQVQVTPLLAEQIVWDEISAYPDGSKAPGWKSFKTAMETALNRNYVLVTLNAVSAKFFLNTVLVNGFKGKWQGGNTKAFKRVAVRLAAQIKEKYGLEIPAVIANHEGGRAPYVHTPTGRGRGRPKGSTNKQEATPTAQVGAGPVKRVAKRKPIGTKK